LRAAARSAHGPQGLPEKDMKYQPMVIAAMLAASTPMTAVAENVPTDDRYVDNMVDCISDFIASEQDDSTKEQYIAACMQAKADKQKAAAGMG
jgi:hypothetical protein